MVKNTRLNRVSNLLVLITMISGLIMIPNQSVQALPSGVSDYFIPTTSQQVFNIFVDNDNDPALVQAQGMRYVIGVTAYVNNTTIFYDHWEDGYDFNETNFSNADETYSVALAGGVANFVSFNVPVPRAAPPTAINACGAGGSNPSGASTNCYDGGDHIYIVGAAAVTLSLWPESIQTVYALSWGLFPTKPYQTTYTIPVGENLAGYDDFANTYVIAQSTQDGNTVTINDPSTAGVDVNVVLNKGQVTQLYSIDSGTTVTGTYPVQVQFIAGEGPLGGQASEFRGWTMVPTTLWDDEYYSPVSSGTVASATETELYIYNPPGAAMTVTWEDGTGTGTFNLPAGTTRAYSAGTAANHIVPRNSGVRLTGTRNFWVIGAVDTEDYNLEWGFQLIPAFALVTEYYLGWAPGTSAVPPANNCSPVWVTPVNDNTVVKFDYSPVNGIYETTVTLNRLASYRAYDPDFNNTGMNIVASGPIAVVWGEASLNQAGAACANTSPNMDLGYTVVPIIEEGFNEILLNLDKTADPTSIANAAGQSSEFTLVVNTERFAVDNVDVVDVLPPNWNYVNNSTTITFPDNSSISGGAANPTTIALPTLTWNIDVDMPAFETLTVRFTAITTAAPGGTSINEGSATGTFGTLTYTASDTATVDSNNTPNFSITKVAAEPGVDSAGDVIHYTVTLINTGSTALTGVTVSDPLVTNLVRVSGDTDGDNQLDATEAWVYTGTYTVLQSDIDNNGGGDGDIDNTVTGDTTQTTPRTASEDVKIVHPALTIVKTAIPVTYTAAGNVINYSYLVTNSGDVMLVGPFTITDDKASDENCPALPASLNPGETVTCTASYTIMAGDVTAKSVTNVASAHGFLGTTPVDSPTDTETVYYRALTLVKTATPATYTSVGNVINYSFSVTNTGGLRLLGPVTVADDKATNETCPAVTTVGNNDTYLDPGESITCTASYTITAGDVTAKSVTNVASASADGTNSNTDTETVNYIALTLDKAYVNYTDNDSSGTISLGDDLNYTITMTNIGNTTLTSVVVSDPDLIPTNASCPSVSPLGTCVLTGSREVTQVDVDAGEFENTATVTDNDICTTTPGPECEDTEIVLIPQNPVINIRKNAEGADSQQALVGDTVTFTIYVENTGDVTLTNVVVSDPLVPDCDTTIASLAADANTSYTCTVTAAADFTNLATVTGTPPVGPDVTDTDPSSVDVIAPDIDIRKNVEGADSQQALVGDTVTFTIYVENTGDVTLTNVVVSDPLVPDCDTTIASLAADANTSYTCTVTAAADFTNLATVTGTPPVGPDVTDTDPSSVDVIAPDIDIRKNVEGADSQQALVGDTVTFTIYVENTGDVTLTNVVVSDPLVPDCDTTIASLAADANTSYTCTVTAAADFTNLATVTGTPPVGPDVTDTDPSSVDVIAPDIDIRKNVEGADSQQALVGDTVTFTIYVENTGDVTLTNVVVSDPLVPDCDTTIASLAADANTSYTCTVTAAADFTNLATVTGTPPVGPDVTDTDPSSVDVIAPDIDIRKNVEGADSQQALVGDTVTFTIYVENTGDVTLTNVVVSDPLVPDCDTTIASLAADANTSYTCTVTAAADFTNLATVTGTPPVGPDVTDTDPSSVDVIAPDIDIRKNVEGADSQQALVGDTVTFTIYVENTGDVTLTNVVVSDPLVPDCDTTIASLAADANTSYTCTVTAAADFTNLATVTGTPPVGPDVTDTDPSSVDVIAPDIDIRKNVEGADSQQALVGDTVTFTIYVENTGDVTLTNVVVSDPLVPDCDTTIASLAADANTSYTCTVTAAADFTNLATVTGTPPVGPDVTDTDPSSVDVIAPDIDIRKNVEGADSQQALVGDTVTFTIYVENTGDVTLTNVVVSDPLVPDCDTTIASLAADANTSYTCTVTAAADFTNLATVTGTPPVGPDVTDTDPSSVDVIAPDIDIRKNVEGADSQQALVGDTVTFTIYVENTGDVTLTNVVVSDPLVPDCDTTIASLAADANTSYTCTVTAAADFTNLATVTGTPPVGPDVTDTDPSSVDVIAPDIDIRKNVEGADSQQALVGDTVTFTIYVENTGDVTLTNVVVSDPLVPDCDTTIASLAADANTSYTCTVTAAADFTNLATVTGTPPVGPDVTDTDPSSVDVIAPDIDIRKNVEGADSQQALVGDTVTFTIYVENTGDVTLTNVVVSDPLVPDCDTTIASLAADANTSYTCTVTAAADFTNLATVTGTPPVGPDVTDTDPSSVDVIAPDIDIRKNVEGADSQQALVGDTVTFTIYVENTGDVTLTNVVVSDPLVPDCDTTIASLAADANTSYTCTVTAAADFTNLATVTGTPPVGPDVTDTDPSSVDVIAPDIDIRKNVEGADSQQALVGDTVTFTIYVENTGDVTLTNVVVSDPLVPDCDTTIASLAADANTSYTCTVTAAADFTNLATVTGTPPVGPDVTDTDPPVWM